MATGSLGADDAVSTPVFVGPGQTIQATLSGTWVARVLLEKSDNSGLSYSPLIGLASLRANGVVTRAEQGLYRLRVKGYTSGSATYDLSVTGVGSGLSSLPPASSVGPGVTAYTTDAGQVYSDGQSWVPLSLVVPNIYVTNHTLDLTDVVGVTMNSASANSLTVPPNSSVAFKVGQIIPVEEYGAGITTLVAGAGVTIRSRGAILTLAGQYAVASLRKVSTDEWIAAGDLA